MLGIDGIKNCKDYNQNELENLNRGPMASKTSDAARYEIKIGRGKFTIIDTPGLGDSRGLKTDVDHIKQIKQMVQKEGGINAIVVV